MSFLFSCRTSISSFSKHFILWQRLCNTSTMSAARGMCTDIVWVDMEMSGLDINKDKILEISCLITDKDLNITYEGPSLVIQQTRELLDNMDKWCLDHHNKSGLVQRCLDSQVTIEQAENILLDFITEKIPKRECPLAGNSVYMDRLFMRREMPKLNDYLHYRIIDVSTVKELARRWNLDVMTGAPKKKFAHRTLDDIKDSIEELKYYKENFFKHKNQGN